ncbi:MAG TPA: DUF4178 domain-containing protein [Chitinophaga sp.]|nr:DUF4178 domain-containing protein [Chitinophaga sp.]
MSITPNIYQCPSCSRAVNFTTSGTTILVCTCGTVLNRMDDGRIVPRPFAVIAEKASVIAPGTSGKWNNKKFTVTGRFRAWLEEAVISYWTICFEDGLLAYLVDGYGMYAICLPKETSPEMSRSVLDIKHGQPKTFYNTTYILERKNKCIKWEVEGELFIPECNTTFNVHDFASTAGKRLHIIEYWPKITPVFEIHYTDTASLALEHTRTYENPGRTFNCTYCGNSLHVRTYPTAQSCACPGCGSTYVLEHALDYIRLKNQRKSSSTVLHLRLGQTGTLFGITYKVVGCMEKKQHNDPARWREYTLFNEQEGYAFLSEFDGHWIYVREKGEAPVPEKKTIPAFTYEGYTFKLFNDYNSEILHAAGEFPGNVFNDHQIKAMEYISPPYLWILEYSHSEGFTWFKGEHLSQADMRAAFGAETELPAQSGVGMVQPPHGNMMSHIALYSLYAMFFMIAVHIMTTFFNKQQTIYHDSISFSSDTIHTQSTVVNGIHLDKTKSNIQMNVGSTINNSWIEIEATLTNTSTGNEYTVNEGLEYYSGVSGGESWSEGSQDGTVYFSEIPAGDYVLKFEATREPGTFPVQYYNAELIYDVPNTRNLFICLGFLLIWPVFRFIGIYYNEATRWSNSQYNPYAQDE